MERNRSSAAGHPNRSSMRAQTQTSPACLRRNRFNGTQISGKRMLATVVLIKALGGGWTRS